MIAGITEKQVSVAAKLYEARNAMRRLLGDKYPATVEGYKDHIRVVMAKANLSCMEASIVIVKALQADKTSDTGMQEGMIFAACVEISEEK